MELNVVNIVLIVAASQSFLLAVLIFQKHRALFANRFLAALLFCFTVISIHLLIQDAGVYQIIPFVFVIVGIPLTASPLQFLYTKYLLRRQTHIAPGDWIHFALFLLFESALLIAFVFGFVDFSEATAATPDTAPFFLRLFNWLLIAQGLFYVAAGLRLIIRFNKQLKEVLSSIEQLQMNWLRNTTLAMLSAWILFLVEDTLMTQGINLSNYVFVSVVFAIYVYAMGFFGLMKSEIFSDPSVEKVMHVVEEIEITQDENNGAKYQRSGLSDETAGQYLQSLLRLMEEKKIYRNSSLTLTELSEELSVSPHNLSEVINTKLRKNFYDFVNGYRLEEAKKDLADRSKQHLKILSIAFDAGFNSKATFNTLFKEQTGVTPSEYRKKLLLSTIGE
ncbi:MAG: helix-turn-helix domain-containing protein [Bacteroidota bacterium]